MANRTGFVNQRVKASEVRILLPAPFLCARMAKWEYAWHLKCHGAILTGSSPVPGTIFLCLLNFYAMIIDFLSNTTLTEAKQKSWPEKNKNCRDDHFLKPLDEQSNKEPIMSAETVKLDFRSILRDIEKPFNDQICKRYVDAVKRSSPVDAFILDLNTLLSHHGFDNISCSFLYHYIAKEEEK